MSAKVITSQTSFHLNKQCGVLYVSDTETGCFVSWSLGDKEWHHVSGSAYSSIIALGNGWFYLTAYWEGLGLATEKPFQVSMAMEGTNDE